MACSTWASAKCPIRHLAITGMDTAAMMPSIMSGSLILATPPCERMSAGTRSRAITATAPASSAILAWSGVTTSMITPPLSISAMPRLTRAVPVTGSVLTVDTSNLARSIQAYLSHRMACLLATGIQRGGGEVGEQGIVHLEELRHRRLAGQAQRAGERTVPGVPGHRHHVVVELAGEEDLMRGRLDLGEQLVGAVLAAEGGPEVRLAEGGPQRPG